MKPLLALLIEDIKYDIIEIENTAETEYLKVSEIYLKIYKRFELLSKEAFTTDESYERFEYYKTNCKNSVFMLENGIKDDLYSKYNFLQIRKDLEQLCTYLSILK